MTLRRLVAELLAPPVGRRRLAEYVACQTALGRAMAAVLDDPYVINRMRRDDRLRLLEGPGLLARWHLGLALDAPPGSGPRPPRS